jgi:uncharacterized protein
VDIDRISRIAYEIMKDRKAQPDREVGYIYYHGKRVGKLAIRLRERLLPCNDSYDRYLLVAALFHDVGKGFDPHAEYGAFLVRNILKEYCCEDEINKIAELIYYHQGPRKEESLCDYIKILQDADILDRFGTMQIWLNIYDCASKNMPVEQLQDFYNNEIDVRASYMRSLLNFDLSLQIFDEKMRYLQNFIDRLRIESAGDICI